MPWISKAIFLLKGKLASINLFEARLLDFPTISGAYKVLAQNAWLSCQNLYIWTYTDNVEKLKTPVQMGDKNHEQFIKKSWYRTRIGCGCRQRL